MFFHPNHTTFNNEICINETYVRILMLTQQVVISMTSENAAKTQEMKFSYAAHAIYVAFNTGNLYKWEGALKTTIMDEIDFVEFNALDATRIWPT